MNYTKTALTSSAATTSIRTSTTTQYNLTHIHSWIEFQHDEFIANKCIQKNTYITQKQRTCFLGKKVLSRQPFMSYLFARMTCSFIDGKRSFIIFIMCCIRTETPTFFLAIKIPLILIIYPNKPFYQIC